jgi:hypothetical protein
LLARRAREGKRRALPVGLMSGIREIFLAWQEGVFAGGFAKSGPK